MSDEAQRTDGRIARGEQRRALILRAAVAVIARDGIAALTHRAAATEAGVSLASVSYHFAGIADLVFGAYTWAGADIVGRGEAAVAAIPRGADPAVAAGEVAADLIESGRASLITVIQVYVSAAGDARLRTLADGFAERFDELLSSFVPTERTRVLLAAINGILLIALGRDDGAAWATVAVRDIVARSRV